MIQWIKSFFKRDLTLKNKVIELEVTISELQFEIQKKDIHIADMKKDYFETTNRYRNSGNYHKKANIKNQSEATEIITSLKKEIKAKDDIIAKLTAKLVTSITNDKSSKRSKAIQ